MSSRKIPESFYISTPTLEASRKLLGKKIFSNIDGKLTGGIIFETEAYMAPEDKGSHAYGNKRTKRTEVQFHSGGKAYVYFTYGMHYMLCLTTGPEDVAHCILIRSFYPTKGLDTIIQRRKKEPDPNNLSKGLTDGPGKVSQALGITKAQNGISLNSDSLWVEEGFDIPDNEVKITPRIGIDYAEEYKDKPWRFVVDKETIQKYSKA